MILGVSFEELETAEAIGVINNAVQDGRVPYVIAQETSVDVAAYQVVGFVTSASELVRESLSYLSLADTEGTFEPPLSPEISAALQLVNDSTQETTGDLSWEALDTARRLASVIVDHGTDRSYTVPTSGSTEV